MIPAKSDNGIDNKEQLSGGISEESQYKGWGYRHQQCLILLCCLTTAYSMRVNMGVALVAMTQDPHKSQTLSNSSFNFTDFNGTSYNSINNTHLIEQEHEISGLLFAPPYPKFEWDKKTQDALQSSFFWGYMILQIPAGQLVHYFGARYLIAFALLLNCVTSIIFPWAAFYGGYALMMVCRVIQGLGQAFVMPGIHTFLGKWTPLEERGRLTALIMGGQALGTVLGLPITGFLAASSFGWPGVFRFYGILSGIVGGLVWWLIADTPAKNRSISIAERCYIEEKLGQVHSKGSVAMTFYVMEKETTSGSSTNKSGPLRNVTTRMFSIKIKRRTVPWGKIMRCRGLYANIFAHIGTTWGQLTLFSEVPAYMDKVMGVNIKANGLLTALPFFIMWFANCFFSWFTDMLIVKKYLSVTNTRKLANSLGSIPPAMGLIVLAYAPRNIYFVEVVLVVICSFKIATHVGFFVNHIDITPNFSGTMLSISNFMSNLFGCAAPLVAGFILTDVTNVLLWRKVFFLSSGVYFFTNLVYVVLGTTERAEWDNLENEEKVNIKEEETKQPML